MAKVFLFFLFSSPDFTFEIEKWRRDLSFLLFSSSKDFVNGEVIFDYQFFLRHNNLFMAKIFSIIVNIFAAVLSGLIYSAKIFCIKLFFFAARLSKAIWGAKGFRKSYNIFATVRNQIVIFLR